MPSLLSWSFALAQPLLVASLQDCPAPAAVEARVREILGLRAEQVLDERATIDRRGSSLRVTVRGKDDRVLGDRVLEAEGSCDDLAGASAVVLAAWLSDVHPEFVGVLPDNPPAPPAAPPVVRDEAPPPGAPLSTKKVRHFELGAALGAGLSSASPVPLAALSARYVPARWGLGGALSATIMGERGARLSSGSVSYFRWPLLLGPLLRVPLASVALDVHAGAALGWLHVEGVDFSAPVSHDAFLGGGFFATRASLGSGSFVPFAELSGVLWRSAEAFVNRGPDQPSVRLPNLELYAALGATWQGR